MSLDIKPTSPKWNKFLNSLGFYTSNIECTKCKAKRYESYTNYLVCSCCGTYVEGTYLF